MDADFYMAEPEVTFGEIHFGKCSLGDKRRTRRLVAIADSLVKNPSGSLPSKLNGQGELDGLYHLMKQKSVTHASVLAAHFEGTRETLACSEEYVVIAHDTTELDFTSHESLTDLGQIGKGNCRGYLCHNSLAVLPQTRQVIGLANQILWKRRRVQEGETRSQRREHENRESQIWKQATDSLPRNLKLIDVCDRGADVFEFLEFETKSGRTFVVRSKHNRSLRVENESGKTIYLYDYVRNLPSLGTKIVEAPISIENEGKSQKARKTMRLAKLQIAVAKVSIPRPKRRSGQHGNLPLEITVVRVWEPNPPVDEVGLEWILLTNFEAVDLATGSLVVSWYECRWVVEEYHKAKKTGLNIEDPQFQSESRLEPMIALLSVVAISLLNLRALAGSADSKNQAARTVMHPDYIESLSLWRYKQVRPEMSIHDFCMALGRLGGHLNRKRDGIPGWITLWRGWMKLNDRVEGARDLKRKQRCA